LTIINHYSQEDLVDRLRRVKLRGQEIYPYFDAFISVEKLDPAKLSPCQRYVLLPELRKIEQVRWRLLGMNVDIFDLGGYVEVASPNDEVTLKRKEMTYDRVDVLPIIVEEDITPFGEVRQIINDGMHRAYLAYQMGVFINVAYIRGADQRYPYYSYALPEGWQGVHLIDQLTPGYPKKFHTRANHKELFRDFTSQFNNLSVSREATDKKG
jgi:hypothetical protein